MWCWLFGCVNRLARFAVVSSTGSVSSRRSRGERRGRRSKGARSARVRAQCAHGAGCLVVRIVWIVCGALRGGQFDWIGVMARRHGVLVESSSADVEARMALRDIAPLLLEIHPHNH
jgi:hypothetical protein